MWLTDLAELLQSVMDNETTDTVIDTFEVVPFLNGIVITTTGNTKITAQKTQYGILINGNKI